MRLAIISDPHFGDPACSLVQEDPTEPGEYVTTAKYDAFRAAVGQGNDYLVVLGDVFDFSVATYQEAYSAAKAFFGKIVVNGVASEVIYVPGNHDFSAWNTVLHEITVINRMKAGKPIEPPRWSLPGVLDDRPQAPQPGFSLPLVTAKNGTPKYGGLFLDSLSPGQSLVFNVAYPNLYLVTDRGEAFVLTHGHYLEGYWSFAGGFARRIAQGDLKLLGGNVMDMDDLVSLNFPLNELSSASLGQAGPLTALVRTIQKDVKRHKLERVTRYLDRLTDYLDELTKFPWYKQYLEWLTDAALKKLKEMVLEKLNGYSPARNDETFMDTSEFHDLLDTFLVASWMEVCALNEPRYGYDLPRFKGVVFGHTHDPVPPGSPAMRRHLFKTTGDSLSLYNTGGWLCDTDPPDYTKPVGGVVIRYETGVGFNCQTL